MDRNYKKSLLGTSQKAEKSERGKDNNKRKQKDDAVKEEDVDNEDDYGCSHEEDDPQYEHFLKNLKKDGNSFVFEYEKDGVPMVIRYEDEEYTSSGDEGTDPDSRRAPSEKIHEANDLEKAKQCNSSKQKNAASSEKTMCPLEGNESDSDLEIIEVKAPQKKRSSSSFMRVDDDEGHLGGPSASKFREKVLDVLKKPFDNEEYKNHQELVRASSYFVYYPDLREKLIQHRYDKRKRLNILRGFFFFIQNLTQEGAFEPWNDDECLAVKPGSA